MEIIYWPRSPFYKGSCINFVKFIDKSQDLLNWKCRAAKNSHLFRINCRNHDIFENHPSNHTSLCHTLSFSISDHLRQNSMKLLNSFLSSFCICHFLLSFSHSLFISSWINATNYPQSQNMEYVESLHFMLD